VAVFADEVAVPEMPWKVDPQRGHVMGEVRYPSGDAVDAGDVEIAAVPGEYRITVTPVGDPPFTSECRVTIAPGLVSRLDIVIDREAAQTPLHAAPRAAGRAR
jgi:hypothetical protein